MNWRVMIGTAVVIAAIVAYEWPKMKHYPRKDKASFIVLILLGWILAQFDLQYLAGPTTLLESIFKPVSKLLNM
ncbi:hypothetical protein [Cohnella cholangitidis]|uniref:Uncharacterized protein n=1 Tax=Cohnella cholangitidis TaxID=2598458 RepID=A0A7G5C689_9BACL|nr:hypothetical protein [Cohnella cholangitidis]QMV44723.1 hypothetical protein FPL14_28805 [Cohnella cholangitidis]